MPEFLLGMRLMFQLYFSNIYVWLELLEIIFPNVKNKTKLSIASPWGTEFELVTIALGVGGFWFLVRSFVH